MQRRTEILGAVAILVLLIAVILFIVLRGKSNNDNLTPVDDGGQHLASDEVPEVSPESVPSTQTVSAGTVAQVFVERLGSYSSESDYENIDDILTLATPTFQNELKRIQTTARANAGADDAYYGISTRILSQSLVSSSDTETAIKLMTQRSEAVGSPANAVVKYQEITVSLVKDGDTWKVNSFTWGS